MREKEQANATGISGMRLYSAEAEAPKAWLSSAGRNRRRATRRPDKWYGPEFLWPATARAAPPSDRKRR